MRKLRKWREVILQEMLVLGFVSSGVLVVIDCLTPESRLKGVGLLVGMVSCTALVVRKFNRLVAVTWEAGRRAERRRVELEAATEPQPRSLAAVREVAPR